ncbi:MAG TPA: tyrosine--tRNA ligase [Elusimicrobia bacterium]|nr:tyrosine--tRNA ligase [Elusimicrobiota bacterium]
MELNKQVEIIKTNTVDFVTKEELFAKLNQDKPLRIKLGIDPTAPDLHLGHTVILRKLRQFQDLGHKIIFIIGDFTARIGDPSGQNETRPMLTEKEINTNAKTLQKQISKILNIEKIELCYNSRWLSKIFQAKDLVEVTKTLRNLFGLFTVQQLLQRDDFTKRQEAGKPITILEMMYPLFQAYDSVMVKADVEIGGTDQLFNLLLGREMQGDFAQEPQVVLTLPLLEGTDGVRKMSKSYGNYIGINEPAKEIYGKIMSISDELMYRWYQLLTEHKLEEIKKLHPREAKAKLAYEITAQYYNETTAQVVENEFNRIFAQDKFPEKIEECILPQGKISIVDLVYQCKLEESKNAIRRLIRQGGIKLDNQKVQNEKEEIFLNRPYILQVGKRKFKKIIPQS